MPLLSLNSVNLAPAVQHGCRSAGLACPLGSSIEKGAPYGAPQDHWTCNRLLVVADASAQIADLGYEAHFLKGWREGARFWKHVARHFSDFTFRLLRSGVDCRTIPVAVGVL